MLTNTCGYLATAHLVLHIPLFHLKQEKERESETKGVRTPIRGGYPSNSDGTCLILAIGSSRTVYPQTHLRGERRLPSLVLWTGGVLRTEQVQQMLHFRPHPSLTSVRPYSKHCKKNERALTSASTRDCTLLAYLSSSVMPSSSALYTLRSFVHFRTLPSLCNFKNNCAIL